MMRKGLLSQLQAGQYFACNGTRLGESHLLREQGGQVDGTGLQHHGLCTQHTIRQCCFDNVSSILPVSHAPIMSMVVGNAVGSML